MKKIIPLLCSLLICPVIKSQIGINTAQINSASMFHINSSTKGVLVPRIQLKSINSHSPLPKDITEGTLVFNEGIAGIGDDKIFSGFYYWKDSKWNTLMSKNDDTDYKVVQFSNNPDSNFNFNGSTIGFGKETDIFGVEIFNDDPNLYKKLSDNSIQFLKDGLYFINLNLALEDETSNNKIYGVNSNVEIFMSFTIEHNGTETQPAEGTLTMVPQLHDTGSELISDTTPSTINTASSNKTYYTRGKFTFTQYSYLQAKEGDILRLRSLQTNTTTRANGRVSYDKESLSNITIIKLN
ncbi:hypothetical protein [Apibacter adventoris]|uniref:hypothetical protein n=1 Tax=Apibacter adventoris TaxID=1679466 RepID=UPI000CF60B4E|nr:hypothetical protein [Apibacter adventoris]PQL95743.1 hypothetical protein C4S76_00870 [Apibacter adventoris]